MDWIQKFSEKFEHCLEVKTLARRKFHGSLTINFSDGVPHTFKIEQHFKAKENQPKPQEVK